ncbi:MAG: glycosyltransferase [Chloroherpetonaceae bacterium]|nr:glycosyltransferase [Chloroherpetonaceae bacterium]
MISILICSIKPDLLEKAKANFTDTVGCEHEILFFDNRLPKLGICAVYNQLTKDAKYPLIAFMHEDVEIRTKGWGKEAIDFFQSHPNAGLLGPAGITFVGHRNFNHVNPYTTAINLVQEDLKSGIKHHSWKPDGVLDFFRVAAVDGCFMIAPKEVCLQHPFDEKTFDFFHLYDMDFSMQVLKTHQVFACTKWDVTHFSFGSYNTDQKKYHLRFIEKWKHHLPVFFPLFPHHRNHIIDTKVIEVYRYIQHRLFEYLPVYIRFLMKEFSLLSAPFEIFLSHLRLIKDLFQSFRRNALKKFLPVILITLCFSSFL